MENTTELTHDEMWDDSALVNSWNEAFEEYKKYHSLAARGEKAELTSKPVDTSQENGDEADLESNKNQASETTANVGHATTTQASIGTTGPHTGPTNMPAAQPGLSGLPQILLGSGQDDNIKNIMMSWYYAGYYTGLYEGQQKAYAAMQDSG